MKIVIDTSVFVSALISRNGEAVEVLRLALQGMVVPQMGTKLFLEYEALLNREEIKNISCFCVSEAEELLDALMSVSQWNQVYYLWRPNLADEADNHVIELAVASNASIIVTYNTKDFKNKQLSFDIGIATPSEFLRSIK
jgi:uncharacterized protein